MPLADDRFRAHRRAVDARCAGHSTILQIPQAVLRMSPVRGTASPAGRARKVTTFPSRSVYGPMSTTSSSNTSTWMSEPMDALVRSRCASALASVSRRGLSAARGTSTDSLSGCTGIAMSRCFRCLNGGCYCSKHAPCDEPAAVPPGILSPAAMAIARSPDSSHAVTPFAPVTGAATVIRGTAVFPDGLTRDANRVERPRTMSPAPASGCAWQAVSPTMTRLTGDCVACDGQPDISLHSRCGPGFRAFAPGRLRRPGPAGHQSLTQPPFNP